MSKSRILLLALVIPPLLAIISCGSGDPKLDAKLADLRSSDAGTRASAINQLAAMEGKESTFIPKVIGAMGDDSEQVRLAAISVIGGYRGELEVQNSKANKKLCALAVKDSSAQVRLNCITVLRDSYPNDKRTVDTFAQALDDEDLDVAAAAAQALLQVGPEGAASAIQKIAEVLKRVVVKEAEMGDKAALTGQGLAMELAKLGPKASQAVPSLKAILDDPQIPAQTKEYITETLDAVGGGEGP